MRILTFACGKVGQQWQWRSLAPSAKGVCAGTEIGKTFAYLVPALLSGERVLLSIATKALQDQLYSRDLPHLAKVLNIPVRFASLKGRSSYLCLHCLDISRQDRSVQDHAVVRVLSTVEEWCRSTRTGDVAELTGLDEHSPAMELFTSTRQNCLGSQREPGD